MNEEYAEWLVMRKDGWWTVPVMILMSAALFAAFAFTFGTPYGFILIVALIAAILYGWRFLHIEYEYIFVGNEFIVDRIFNKKSRKNARKITLDHIESVEPTSMSLNENRRAGGMKLENFWSNEKDAKTYTMVYTDKSGRKVLVFEPDEKFLKAMWRVAPGKVRLN